MSSAQSLFLAGTLQLHHEPDLNMSLFFALWLMKRFACYDSKPFFVFPSASKCSGTIIISPIILVVQHKHSCMSNECPGQLGTWIRPVVGSITSSSGYYSVFSFPLSIEMD